MMKQMMSPEKLDQIDDETLKEIIAWAEKMMAQKGASMKNGSMSVEIEAKGEPGVIEEGVEDASVEMGSPELDDEDELKLRSY